MTFIRHFVAAGINAGVSKFPEKGGIPTKINGFASDSFENRYFGVITILGNIHKGHMFALCSPAFTVLTTSFPSAFGDQSAGTSPETNSN